MTPDRCIVWVDLQVQHLAVRCIQRNVKKYMLIREWPWWKLYTKVKPILNVHRTEEELVEALVGGGGGDSVLQLVDWWVEGGVILSFNWWTGGWRVDSVLELVDWWVEG